MDKDLEQEMDDLKNKLVKDVGRNVKEMVDDLGDEGSNKMDDATRKKIDDLFTTIK